MPECQNCAGHVSEQFHQVFAGNDGEVHGCPDCLGSGEIINGKATPEP